MSGREDPSDPDAPGAETPGPEARPAAPGAARTSRAGLAGALAVAMLAAIALAAWIGATRQAGPAFSDLPGAPGFRQLGAQGGVSGGAAMFLGLDGPGPEASADLCADLWRAPGLLATGASETAPGPWLAVFSDANCPYCRILDGVIEGLEADRPGLRVIHHEWPVLGPGSVAAARAALAAEAQGEGRGDALRRRLLQTRFVVDAQYLRAAAEAEGLDPDRLLTDAAQAQVDATLAATDRAARALGLGGTPAVVIGASLIEGVTDRAQLESLLEIEAARAPVCPLP